MTAGQQTFTFRTHGGKRRGAGRKPRGHRAGVSHDRRPAVSSRHPLLVTLKVRDDVPNLRRHEVWKALQYALAVTAARTDFRICHATLQGNHLHLLVEADDQRAMSRGMQGFQISFAKQLNGRLGRRGRVFADRYHAESLTNPTHVRNALRYTLGNWRRHGVDRGSALACDPFSSGVQFDGWAELQGTRWIRGEMLPIRFRRPGCSPRAGAAAAA
jgi:REP element-mobilizing transposase RayT